jgi:hypothetical protein
MPELDLDLGARRWAMVAWAFTPKQTRGQVLLHWTGPDDPRANGNCWTTATDQAAVFESAEAAEQAWRKTRVDRKVKRPGTFAMDLDKPDTGRVAS